jgi:cell wall assembly regulator SMI1
VSAGWWRRGAVPLGTVCVLVALLAAGSGLPASRDAHPARYAVTVRLVPGNRLPFDPRPTPHLPTPSQPTTHRQPPPVRVPACHPAGARIAVAPVDPAVTASVNAAWTRIERWLAAHAPATFASLRPPASPATIAAAQAALGRPLPPELVASLRRHDGTTADGRAAFTLPPFYRPVSATDIPAYWRVSCGVIEDLPGSDPWWWTPAYTPFAADGSGDELILDQRPGRSPHVGEFDIEQGTTLTRWPATLTALLEVTADALETGHPWNGFQPAVTAGALRWDIR